MQQFGFIDLMGIWEHENNLRMPNLLDNMFDISQCGDMSLRGDPEINGHRYSDSGENDDHPVEGCRQSHGDYNGDILGWVPQFVS